MTAAAARANILLLQQADDLLTELGGERYASRVPACFNSSPGGHLRHITDHYLGLLDGLSRGEVDYEHRARDPRVECDSGHAQALVRSLIARLEDVAEADCDVALKVRAEAADEEGDHESDPSGWSDTSLLRELEFMLSHTVHHYALVAVMCRLLGHETPADFGMAPSTIRHLRRQSQGAMAAV
jgi:uncharacterized damage-inducible protein DinB